MVIGHIDIDGRIDVFLGVGGIIGGHKKVLRFLSKKGFKASMLGDRHVWNGDRFLVRPMAVDVIDCLKI